MTSIPIRVLMFTKFSCSDEHIPIGYLFCKFQPKLSNFMIHPPTHDQTEGGRHEKNNLPSNRWSLIIVFTSYISFWQKKASRSIINLTEAIFYIGQLMVRKRSIRFSFALKPMPCARQVKFLTWGFYRSSSVCVVGENRVYLLKLSLLVSGI